MRQRGGEGGSSKIEDRRWEMEVGRGKFEGEKVGKCEGPDL
jgi:hypothetical protein